MECVETLPRQFHKLAPLRPAAAGRADGEPRMGLPSIGARPGCGCPKGIEYPEEVTKMKKLLAAVLCCVMAVSLAACNQNKGETITFVLDWTPNTNHTGVYVAQKLGYFADAGLNVEIVDSPEDGATPLVASGKAQFGVDFQDYLAPAFVQKMPVTAVAAIIQHNTSGIVSKKGQGIDRPRGLEGKTYATWDLPVEKKMMEYIVEKDGGDFSKVNLVPTEVQDLFAALNSDIDAVWIYYAWDGIATQVKGLETDYFAFKDIDPVFDYYTPVIIANNDFLAQNPDAAKKFMQAVQKGYEYAIAHPDEAADILLEYAPALDEEIVRKSQQWLSGQYRAEAARWGLIDGGRWDAFYEWLWENKLIEEEIPAGFGYSNDYLAQ
jgi:ABC-type nitrate/sulfonate/bicarbonate transport system substrate-binding protein